MKVTLAKPLASAAVCNPASRRLSSYLALQPSHVRKRLQGSRASQNCLGLEKKLQDHPVQSSQFSAKRSTQCHRHHCSVSSVHQAHLHPAHGRNSGSSMKVCVSSGLTKPLWPAAVNVRHGVKTQARLSKIFEKQHPESIILDLSKHTCASQPSSPQHAHCLQATQLSTGSH